MVLSPHICAKCGGESQVIDCRDGHDKGTCADYFMRRRKCKTCHFRWTTHERRIDTTVLVDKSTYTNLVRELLKLVDHRP